jgi:hypothetical protein
MARTYRTSGVNTDGTSTLAATSKKKSKSKKLWTAIGIGALAIGGLSVYGGWGSGNGLGFLGNVKEGWGKLFASSSTVGDYVNKTTVSQNVVSSPISTALSSAGKGSTMGTIGSLASQAGTGLKGYFSNITSGQAMLTGYGLQALGTLFDKGDQEALALNASKHEDLLDYNYAALEAEVGIAEARQAGSDRRDAVASTYMGHTSPIMGNVEGVSGVTPGYTPKKPKNYEAFHPVGGLISEGSVA